MLQDPFIYHFTFNNIQLIRFNNKIQKHKKYIQKLKVSIIKYQLNKVKIQAKKVQRLAKKMFIMLPCPTIVDNVSLPALGQLKNSVPKFNQTRNIIRKFSDTSNLISSVQNGQTIMMYKVKFDQYIKSHVDLMKSYVATNSSCQFKYNGFFSPRTIQTSSMSPKQQWGFQIIMTRYILSSIYIGGSIESIGKLFQQTSNSYMQGYANTSQFTKNLQVTFKYFTQSIDPLKRLATVINSVALLFTSETKNQISQANPEVFKFFTELIQSNLAYLKLEKYRVLNQYKSCKEGAWAVYQKMKDLKASLSHLSDQFQFSSQISNFINLGIVFYKAYALNSLLLQNQQKKLQQEYGFIKKQFQEMINQNLVVADQILKLGAIGKKLPGQQQDNVIFANKILEIMGKHAQSIKYKFQINLHQNSSQKPSIDQITSRIQSRNIWGSLNQF